MHIMNWSSNLASFKRWQKLNWISNFWSLLKMVNVFGDTYSVKNNTRIGILRAEQLRLALSFSIISHQQQHVRSKQWNTSNLTSFWPLQTVEMLLHLAFPVRCRFSCTSVLHTCSQSGSGPNNPTSSTAKPVPVPRGIPSHGPHVWGRLEVGGFGGTFRAPLQRLCRPPARPGWPSC